MQTGNQNSLYRKCSSEETFSRLQALHFRMLRKDSLERHLARMRDRQKASRLQQRQKQKQEGEREPERLRWEAGRAERKHEGYAFVAMDRYLYHSERAVRRERYVTAMFGCRTSWPRIIEHAKYAVVAEGQQR